MGLIFLIKILNGRNLNIIDENKNQNYIIKYSRKTIYSNQNVIGKIGNNSCEELIDIEIKIEKLKSYLDQNKKEINKKTKYNIKKHSFLLRTKIRNKIYDLHQKICNYLCSNFKNIFLPTFKVSNMVKKDLPHRSRSIKSRSVRKMLSLSLMVNSKNIYFIWLIN